MTQRTFDFRPPQWRMPAQLHYRTGALLMGTFMWLAIYLGVGWRLLNYGVLRAGWTTFWLAVICVVVGIAVVLGWRIAVKRWAMHLRPSKWPALSLAQLYELSPAEFEDYVAQRIFARQGYAVENTPDVKDGGVDILVKDTAGRLAIVQCKRYRGTVGESTIRDLYGTMIHHDAGMAFLVTTGTVSDSARRWAAGKPIRLVDGERLVALSKAEAKLHSNHQG